MAMRPYVSETPCFKRTYRLNLHWFKVREEMVPPSQSHAPQKRRILHMNSSGNV